MKLNGLLLFSVLAVSRVQYGVDNQAVADEARVPVHAPRADELHRNLRRHLLDLMLDQIDANLILEYTAKSHELHT